MKNSNTDIHRKVERMLRGYGWEPLRQFEPAAEDAVGRGELFEIWQRSIGNKTELCLVQFYGDSHGVEFYFRGTAGNTWAEVESLLAPPTKSTT